MPRMTQPIFFRVQPPAGKAGLAPLSICSAGNKHPATPVASVTWNTTAGVNCNSNLQFTTDKLSFSQITFASNRDFTRATAAASPTKFIMEFTIGASPVALELGIDDGTPDFSVANFEAKTSSTSALLYWDTSSFWTYKNGSWTGYNSAALGAANAIITMIGDTSAGTLSFYLNGTLLNTITGLSYANWYAYADNANFAGTYDVTANFVGPFSFPQTGYSAYDAGSVATTTDISGATALTFSASSTLAGIGVLAGSSTLTFSPTTTLGGIGVLAGSSTLTFAPSGTISGRGILAGSSTLTFSPSATLLGKGAIAGSSTLTFAPSATLTGQGTIGGSSALTLAGSATPSGTGLLSGSASLTFTPAATLTGIGQLLASTSITWALSGTLADYVSNEISGTAHLSFVVSGALSNADIWATVAPAQTNWANDNVAAANWTELSKATGSWTGQAAAGGDWTEVPRTGSNWS